MSFVMDTTTGGDFTPAPPGIHPAICLYVADIGTQATAYGPKSQLLFCFELPGLPAADGRPMTISRRFSKSLGEKSALRPFLTSWLGGPLPAQLDLAQLAGRGAMLVITATTNGDRTYSNVTACAPLQPGQAVPAPSTTPLCYGGGRDPQVFGQLPQWIQKAVIAGGAAPAGAPIPAAPMAHAAAYPPAGYAAPVPTYPAPAAVPTAGYVAPTQVAAPVPMPAAAAAIPAPQMQTAPQVSPGVPFDDQLSF